MDDAATVHGLLAAAGLAPPEDDIAILEQTYPVIRQMVSLLYAVEDAREECPALHFRADPGGAGDPVKTTTRRM